MEITVRIDIRSKSTDAVKLKTAEALHNAIREAARPLATKINVLLGGQVNAVAVIYVQDGLHSPVIVNLGENNDKNTDYNLG